MYYNEVLFNTEQPSSFCLAHTHKHFDIYTHIDPGCHQSPLTETAFPQEQPSQNT